MQTRQPSTAAVEADTLLYGGMWKTYVDAVEKERKLPAGAIMRGIDEAPERLAAAGGDAASQHGRTVGVVEPDRRSCFGRA